MDPPDSTPLVTPWESPRGVAHARLRSTIWRWRWRWGGKRITVPYEFMIWPCRWTNEHVDRRVNIATFTIPMSQWVSEYDDSYEHGQIHLTVPWFSQRINMVQLYLDAHKENHGNSFFGVLPFYPSPCLELEELIATPFLTISWQFDTIQAMALALLGRWCYQCNDHPYLSWKNSGSNIESHSPPGDLESRVFQFNESSIFESGSKAIAQKKTEGCLWSISIYPGRCTKLGQVWCCAWTWNFCSS